MADQFTITNDRSNKDVPKGMDVFQAKEYYLGLYGNSFTSRLPSPEGLVEEFVHDGVKRYVVRCDLSPAGFKAFAAEKVIAGTSERTLVYCAPRVGHAAEAICVLSKMYGKNPVFFCPASNEVSNHQAVLAAYGADLRFIKIAAMPVLNVYARRWAERWGDIKYLTFGLAGMSEVTAGIVKFADTLARAHGEPPEFWCATSTGTMIRGLQIGWPNSKARSVAVARNIHDGEIGRAELTSSQVPFLRACPTEMPHFQTTATYDAKAWHRFKTESAPGSFFINVGADAVIEKRLGEVDKSSLKSSRKWGDLSDMDTPPRWTLQHP